MKRLRKYKIIEKKLVWLSISFIIIALGVFFVITRGFNWGIDFTGGNMLHINLHQQYELSLVRSKLENLI